MPDSESRVERVLSRVVEAMQELTAAQNEQTQVMRDLAESTHRLADAIQQQSQEETGDPAGADLAQPEPEPVPYVWPHATAGGDGQDQGYEIPRSL